MPGRRDRLGEFEELLTAPILSTCWDISGKTIASDGRRLLMVENSDDFPIVIVQNWSEELRGLLN